MPATNGKTIRDERRKDAEVRNSQTAQLSAQQRLDALDARLGKGVGATKERARLTAQLTKKAAA